MRYKNLITIREQNGLTQLQVADALGIHRATYCGYETGRRKLPITTLQRLARFYNISVESFFENNTAEYICDEKFLEAQPELSYLAQLSKEERDLIVNLRIANEDAKKEILEFAKEKSGRKS